ncbi:MAG: glycosyltransferase [Candidatus Paceibacterota bacterium]|jgi:GT2 family glycosyltransferase
MDKRVEIIVLTYKHPEIEAECLKRIIENTKNYKITVYDNSMNDANMSKIWNRLLKETTCDYICIMDSDAYIETKDWLAELQKVLDSDEKMAAVGPSMGADFPTDGTLSGYCFLFKKQILETIGYFDEKFVLYGQECDWMYRILEAGYKMQKVDSVIVKHLGSHTIRDTFTPDEIEKDSQYARKLLMELKNERNNNKA